MKPNRTLPHKVSTPPTMAASTRPSRIIRSAVANTLALDEQAVEGGIDAVRDETQRMELNAGRFYREAAARTTDAAVR